MTQDQQNTERQTCLHALCMIFLEKILSTWDIAFINFSLCTHTCALDVPSVSMSCPLGASPISIVNMTILGVMVDILLLKQNL